MFGFLCFPSISSPLLPQAFRLIVTEMLGDELRAPAVLRSVIDAVLWLLPRFDEHIVLLSAESSRAAVAAEAAAASASAAAPAAVRKFDCARLIQHLIRVLLKPPAVSTETDSKESKADVKDSKSKVTHDCPALPAPSHLSAPRNLQTNGKRAKSPAPSAGAKHLSGQELLPHLRDVASALVTYAERPCPMAPGEDPSEAGDKQKHQIVMSIFKGHCTHLLACCSRPFTSSSRSVRAARPCSASRACGAGPISE